MPAMRVRINPERAKRLEELKARLGLPTTNAVVNYLVDTAYQSLDKTAPLSNGLAIEVTRNADKTDQ